MKSLLPPEHGSHFGGAASARSCARSGPGGVKPGRSASARHSRPAFSQIGGTLPIYDIKATGT
jgi:hypothetical protein